MWSRVIALVWTFPLLSSNFPIIVPMTPVWPCHHDSFHYLSPQAKAL